MILMSGILLLFLMVAAYNIYALYKDLDSDDAVIYANLESKLQLAALNYINDNDLEDEKIIVSLSDLRPYISDFEDDKKRACNGYVIYENYDYSSYISCPEYTSSNYNKIHE